MLVLTLLVSFSVLTSAFYLYLTWHFDYWRKRGVAGPLPRAYVGTFPKTALLDPNSNYMEETSEIYRKYYRKHRFIGVFQYRQPKLLILDPALALDIYVKHFKHFGDNTISDSISATADSLFAANPFTLKYAQWKDIRKELMPFFTAIKVKGMYSAIENACDHMEQYIDKKLAAGQNVFHSKDICSRVVADVTFNVVFGLDATTFDDKSECLERALASLYSTSYESIRSAIYVTFPWVRKICAEQFTAPGFIVWFKQLFDQAVELRRESNASRDDYLNYLIELREKKNMPMDLIYAHADSYFLDGFETTTYALGNIVNNLAANKDCQEKLRAEINRNGHLTLENILQMPYLEAVLNEAIRISPFPFPIWKTCTEDIQLTDYDGRCFNVERGVQIIIPTPALHTHPDFYEHPKTFDPERFDENNGGTKRFKDAGVLTPFGNGPRQCLGMRFAVAKIKAAVCTLVRKYEFTMANADNKPSRPVGMLFFSENSAVIKVRHL